MKFKELWENHPTVKSRRDDAPCKVNGKRAFDNQCAIRLGQALTESGIDLNTFKGARCWHSHKPAHILRAEELAKWLSSSFSPFRKVVKFQGTWFQFAFSDGRHYADAEVWFWNVE